MLLSGSAITYGSYRLLQYLNAQDHQLSYDEFMQKEDVVATLATLQRYLAAKKKVKSDPYKELRQQFTYVCKLHIQLTELIEWRKEKIYRYVYWSGEIKFVKHVSFKLPKALCFGFKKWMPLHYQFMIVSSCIMHTVEN